MTNLAERISGQAPETPDGDKPQTVGQLIEQMRPEFAKVLPEHLSVEHFLRLALTELRQNPSLANCTSHSLLGALMTAARLGLEPGGPLDQFYLTSRSLKVPGGGDAKVPTVVPIIGYQGLRDLAYRSGYVDSIQARLVREGDTFRQGGDSSRGFWFDWQPMETGDDAQRDVSGVVAVAQIKGAGFVWRYLSRAQIEERKNRGAAKDTGPWRTDFDAMALKTGLRALSPDLPKSSAMASAFRVDETPQIWTPTEERAA